jgi:hypothetical protein
VVVFWCVTDEKNAPPLPLASAGTEAPSPPPYREPGARPKLPDGDRRWFTRKDDVEQGPFTAEVLSRSLRSGLLKRTSLVRAEDETEWRPVSSVAILMAAESPVRGAGWTPDPRDGTETGPGSFGAGFAAGFFGGIIGFILVRWLAKGEDTKKGAAVGLGVGLVVGGLLRLLAR